MIDLAIAIYLLIGLLIAFAWREMMWNKIVADYPQFVGLRRVFLYCSAIMYLVFTAPIRVPFILIFHKG